RVLLCSCHLLGVLPGLELARARAQEAAEQAAPAAPAAQSPVDELVASAIQSRGAGRDAAALELYRRANALDPDNARVLAHLGATYQALGRWVLAHTYLSRALEHRDDAYIQRHRAELEEALGIVGEHIGFLEVYGAPDGAEALINGQIVATLPMTGPIPVIVGSYLLEIRFKGHYTLGRPITVAQRGLTREEVQLTPLAAGGPAASEPAQPAPGSAAREPHVSSGGPSWVPWTLGGLSAAAAVTSVIAYSRREYYADRWNDDACLGGGVSREENCGGDYDRGKQAETVMWVSGVAAGVFAAGAVITAIVFSDDEPEQVGFRCAPGLGGASCSGSF
ncbi:MAG TPA: tetratricopeptide repeat protein, partial [Polyangiaceae bacterium]|nr:tetratricopeptide repeat protein [Polyangiaceae bacterium]